MTATLEERLLQGYRAQLGHYDRAAHILEEANEFARQQGETSDPERQRGENSGKSLPMQWTHTLHAALQEAVALDAAMAQDVAAWRASGRSPAGPLQEILERLAQRLRTLSETINQKVSDTRTQQLGLVAEIDEFIQKRRMLRAYVRQ